MQDGMRIKSKDIHFDQLIFCLANNHIFDFTFLSLGFYSTNIKFLKCFINLWL